MKRLHKKLLTTISLLFISLYALADQQLTGIVTDENGEPLIGAYIYLDGKAITATDVEGNYRLKAVNPNSKIEVSYIGYVRETQKVGDRQTLNFILKENTSELDEVIVVGYGTIKKNDHTGAVGSVSNTKLNEKGAASVLENLQGSVPGVNITKSSGRAAGDFNIEIRGKNSISSNQSPLYVIDGVICSNMDFLNPQDIERIDILKDASSTAIYGSRATAGVVMITTKSGATVGGHGMQPTVSYDGYYGISRATNMPDFQNADQFYKYRFMKFLNLAGGNYMNGSPVMINDDINRCLLLDRESGIYRMKELLEKGQTYNWPDYILRDGSQQNHYIAVSGASDRFSYHLGLGYTDEKGIYENDEQNKFSIKGSFDAKLNKIISAGLSVNMARTNHDYASDNAIRYAFRENPFMQPYDENGEINYKPGSKEALHTDEYQFTGQISPLVYMNNEWSNRLSWIAMTNVYLQIQPIKDLTIKTTFSPTYSCQRFGFFQGTEAGETQNEARRISSSGFSWTWDNILTYDHTWAGIHHLNLMGLFSTAYSNGESENLYLNNVLDGTYWWNLGSSNQGYDYGRSGTGYSETSLMSYALRANYSFDERYLFTGTVRWDGSSKFAKGNRWEAFPSLAFAWRISQEHFMEGARDWLSSLKLRLSYGVTGNNNVGNYATQLALGNVVYYPFEGIYHQGQAPAGVVDRKLKWEKSHELNLGLDFGFFNERIRGNIEIYNKKSKDLLYSVRLPLEAGGQSLTTNIGSVRNRGIEIGLTTENIVTRNWHWTTTFTFAHNDNKVLEINGTGNYYSGGSTGNLIIGQPYRNVYGYEWNGIVSNRDMTVPDNEIARLKGFTPGSTVKECEYYYKCYGQIEGNPIIVDRNGDGRFTDEDKKIYNGEPDWTGSFTSNLNYTLPKNGGELDFSFSIYAKQNYTVFSNFYQEYLYMDDRGRSKINVDWYIPAGTLIDCDGVNDDGSYINPKYQETTHYGSYPFPNNGVANSGLGTENWMGSTNSYTDASFVKIKHITLGYSFSKNLLKHFGCSQLRLYCTVTNPFIFTKYKGYDPEWADAALQNDGPSTCTWQFGASIKF